MTNDKRKLRDELPGLLGAILLADILVFGAVEGLNHIYGGAKLQRTTHYEKREWSERDKAMAVGGHPRYVESQREYK